MRTLSFALLTTIVVLTLLSSGWADGTQPRSALVIGNSQYDNKMLRLTNPTSDADAIADVLTKLNYKVHRKLNLTRSDMEQAILEFQADLQPGSSGLIYYAGHAAQLNGKNYLIPVDASFTDPQGLVQQSVDLEDMIAVFRTSNVGPNIVILDACRDNPFVQRFDVHDWIPGLAPPKNAPPNTFIAYATDPGNVADDGDRGHSPYTLGLLKYLKQPGLTLEDVFKDVRRFVIALSHGEQTPWENSSIIPVFHFRDAVAIHAQIFDADDDVFLLINGANVASWSTDGRNVKTIPLTIGDNEIVVKVYNQRSFTGGIEGLGGHLPEGWKYSLQLNGPDNSVLLNLSAAEDRPTKDGPHHGKTFVAATAAISVDEDGLLKVHDLDADIWQRQR